MKNCTGFSVTSRLKIVVVTTLVAALYSQEVRSEVMAFGGVELIGFGAPCTGALPEWRYENRGGIEASGATPVLTGLPCLGSGHGNSSVSDPRGELKAFAIAGPTTSTTAGAQISTNMVFHGPLLATSVSGTLELNVSGITSLPRPQTPPFPDIATSGWATSIIARSTDLPGGAAQANTAQGGDGAVFFHTESLNYTLPVYEGSTKPVHVTFVVRAGAFGSRDPDTGSIFMGEADISHTALISVKLPPGWTFTSDSGVFLSESPLLIPEPVPAILMMLGLGIVVVAASRCRRPWAH